MAQDPPRTLRVPLERQRALYERHASAAVDALAQLLEERRDHLVALGAERAFDQVGLDQYGDSTYFRSLAELETEAEAELADGIFYLHVLLARRAGELDDQSQ